MGNVATEKDVVVLAEKIMSLDLDVILLIGIGLFIFQPSALA